MRKGALLFTISVLTMMRVGEAIGQVVVRDSVFIGPKYFGIKKNGITSTEAGERLYWVETVSYPAGVDIDWACFILNNYQSITVNVLEINNTYPCWWVFVQNESNTEYTEDYLCAAYRNVSGYPDIDITHWTSKVFPPGIELRFWSYYCYWFPSNLVITNFYKQDESTYIIEWPWLVIEVIFRDYYRVTVEPDTIGHLDVTNIIVQPIDENGNVVSIPDETSLNFSLDIQGETYGSYIGPDSSIAKSLSGISYSDVNAGKVKYYADGEEPDELQQCGIIVEESENLKRGGCAVVVVGEEEELDHFLVIIEPDTVNHLENATITVQAKDESGNDVDPPEGTLLNFSLDENGELYGSFLAPDGSTAESLTGITYGDAHAGNVKYVADGEEPDSPVEVLVNVVKSDDEGKKGEGKLMIKNNYSLTIQIPDSAQIWPTLPGGNDANPNNRNVQDSIQVTLMKNNKPYLNQDVTLSLRMILPSGGHDHINEPPPTLMGNLEGQNTDNPQVNVNTGNTGTGIARYTAPEFGGLFEFMAMKIMHPGTEFVDTLRSLDTLTVRVPNLQLLQESTYYTKVGGTCNHHGPSDRENFPDECQTPDNNHYGTATVTRNITFIALYWHLLFPNEHDLYINDMSLPFGGLFDINGNWQPDHNRHRVGTSVDIRTEFPSQREGVPIRSPRNSLEIEHIVGNDDFERICLNHGVKLRIHGEYGTIEEHYHLEFE